MKTKLDVFEILTLAETIERDGIEEEKRHISILRRSLEQLHDPHTCSS